MIWTLQTKGISISYVTVEDLLKHSWLWQVR